MKNEEYYSIYSELYSLVEGIYTDYFIILESQRYVSEQKDGRIPAPVLGILNHLLNLVKKMLD